MLDIVNIKAFCRRFIVSVFGQMVQTIADKRLNFRDSAQGRSSPRRFVCYCMLPSYHKSPCILRLTARHQRRRVALAVTVLNGKLYAVGGMAGEVLRVNEEYDPVTDTWRERAPMPTARHGLGAAAVGGKIYVIGGGVKPDASKSGLNEVFDPGP